MFYKYFLGQNFRDLGITTKSEKLIYIKLSGSTVSLSMYGPTVSVSMFSAAVHGQTLIMDYCKILLEFCILICSSAHTCMELILLIVLSVLRKSQVRMSQETPESPRPKSARSRPKSAAKRSEDLDIFDMDDTKKL